MPYQAMDCDFYEDGLRSETPILTSDDSDECYRALVNAMRDGSIFIGRVVEIDQDGKKVWTETPPYPRIVEPEAPDFYYAYFRGDAK